MTKVRETIAAIRTDLKITEQAKATMQDCRFKVAKITLIPRFLCQNWQSAAPPAIVPSIYGLISIIFFTDCDAGDSQQSEFKIKHNANRQNPSF